MRSFTSLRTRSSSPLSRLPLRSSPAAHFLRPKGPCSRPFSARPVLLIKEDAERSGEEIDQKKHEQIDKQKKGEGHWHEELASGSESSISADRGSHKIDDHEDHMEDLQKETAGKAEKESEHGKAQ